MEGFVLAPCLPQVSAQPLTAGQIRMLTGAEQEAGTEHQVQAGYKLQALSPHKHLLHLSSALLSRDLTVSKKSVEYRDQAFKHTSL